MLDFTNWLLVFVRVSALFAAFPIFSAANFPVRVRVALGACVSFLIVPSLPEFPLTQASIWTLTGLLFKEASVGLLIGFACRMIFFAIELAGVIVSTEMGLALPASFNPLTSGMSTAPGMILYWLAIMLLFSLDMHHWMIAGLQKSYSLAPIGSARLSLALLQDIVARTGSIFFIGLQMTAPMVAVSFMITLLFSLLSRAVPQMNVFSESFPVRVIAGLAVFGLTIHQMALHISNHLHRLPRDLDRVAQLLGGM